MINANQEKSQSEKRKKWEESEGTVQKKGKIKQPERQDGAWGFPQSQVVWNQWLGHWLSGRRLERVAKGRGKCAAALQGGGKAWRVQGTWTLLARVPFRLLRASRAMPESITKSRTGNRLSE